MLISMSEEIHFNGHLISLQKPNVSAWNIIFFIFLFKIRRNTYQGCTRYAKKTIFYLNFSVPFNFLFEKQKLRGNKEKDNSTRCLIFFTKASYTANTLV